MGSDSVRRLDLSSLRLLEQILKEDRSQLFAFEQSAESLYSEFQQPEKRRWFPKLASPEKKPRVLSNPAKRLKDLQKAINKKLLSRVEMASYCFGGVKGRSLLDNAHMHLGSPCLVTVDIKSFFPSVDASKVFYVWNRVLGCSPRISKLLTNLTTRKGCLPQGAPTSPALANIYLMAIDDPIEQFCAKNGIKYSSWIDDLAFSGRDPRPVIPIVIHTLAVHGLRLSRRKVRVMGPGSKKLLTGILMSKFPGVVRARISQLRAGVHKLETRQVPDDQLQGYLKSLNASIRFVEDIIEGRVVQAVVQLRKRFDYLALESSRAK